MFARRLLSKRRRKALTTLLRAKAACLLAPSKSPGQSSLLPFQALAARDKQSLELRRRAVSPSTAFAPLAQGLCFSRASSLLFERTSRRRDLLTGKARIMGSISFQGLPALILGGQRRGQTLLLDLKDSYGRGTPNPAARSEASSGPRLMQQCASFPSMATAGTLLIP